LRVLGVKDVDAYLPTMQEAAQMAQAKAQQPPSPEQQEVSSKVALNQANTNKADADTNLLKAKAIEIGSNVGMDQLAAKKGNLKVVDMT